LQAGAGREVPRELGVIQDELPLACERRSSGSVGECEYDRNRESRQHLTGEEERSERGEERRRR